MDSKIDHHHHIHNEPPLDTADSASSFINGAPPEQSFTLCDYATHTNDSFSNSKAQITLSLCDAYAFYESNKRASAVSAAVRAASSYAGVAYDRHASRGSDEDRLSSDDLDGVVKLIGIKISSSQFKAGIEGDADVNDGLDVPANNDSHSKTVKATYPRPKSEAVVNETTSSSNTSVELSPSQTQNLPFPIGCRVCTHAESPILRGDVTAVFWKVVNGQASHMYGVTSDDGSHVVLQRSELRFASGCPVAYSPSGTYAQDAVVGKILTCQKIEDGDEINFSYTVTIDSSTDETSEGTVRVINGVSPSQLKFHNSALGHHRSGKSPKRLRVKKRKAVPSGDHKRKAKEAISKSGAPPTSVSEPTDLDIIRGRGGGTNHHPGNRRFRDAALKMVPVYSLPTTTKEEKTALALQLVKNAKAQGCRFLGKAKDGLWYHLTERAERNKASQILRDASRNIKQGHTNQIRYYDSSGLDSDEDSLMEHDNTAAITTLNAKMSEMKEDEEPPIGNSTGKRQGRKDPLETTFVTPKSTSQSQSLSKRAKPQKTPSAAIESTVTEIEEISYKDISYDQTDSTDTSAARRSKRKRTPRKEVTVEKPSPAKRKYKTKKSTDFIDIDLAIPDSPDSWRAYDEEPTSIVLEPTDLDILRGRGGLTNKHPGNIRFRDEARVLRDEYRDPKTTRVEKFHLSQQLVDIVKGYGGRFLEKGDDGEWHRMSAKAERKKASQVLREEKWD